MSLCGVLLVIFIVLKLIGAISWSWWWVLSPLWIPIAINLIALFKKSMDDWFDDNTYYF